MKRQHLIAQEYAAARKEGRQPNCPYCHQPLEVAVHQHVRISWLWEDGKYIKSEDGDSDAPFCAFCKTSDWAFIDEDLVSW